MYQMPTQRGAGLATLVPVYTPTVREIGRARKHSALETTDIHYILMYMDTGSRGVMLVSVLPTCRCIQ